LNEQNRMLDVFRTVRYSSISVLLAFDVTLQSAAEKGDKPVNKQEDTTAKAALDNAMKAAMDAEQELKCTPAA
jgi:Holliday junction resolvase RusA-like endonuclease